MAYYFPWLVAVLGTVTVAVMSGWYWRTEREQRIRMAQTKADIADIMILFQTMRDVISQQKNLARDFNQELDRKMSLVKEVLAKSLEKNEKLYERQQELQQQIEELKAELESAQRQTSYLRASTASAAVTLQPAPQPSPAAPAKPAPPVQAVPAPRRAATPTPPPAQDAPRIVQTSSPAKSVPPPPEENPRLAKTGLTDAPYSVWFGLDFDSAPPAAPVEEEEPPMPSAPENPEAARNAFRALLNLPTAPPPAGNGGATTGSYRAPAMPTPSVPLQQRVLEYSEAGMGVAEIARELGIGKGEVRLMLSLAKQKGS